MAVDQPPKRNWWQRNWKWVVPVGCLTPILLCGGLIFFGFMFVMGALKSSDVYTEALKRAQQNDDVKALLGEPIDAGFWTTGSIAVQNGSGNADISIPLSGPKGSATLHAVATKTAGVWQYSTLEVAPKDGGARIDLRPKPGD